jgi:hypothetical protein
MRRKVKGFFIKNCISIHIDVDTSNRKEIKIIIMASNKIELHLVNNNSSSSRIMPSSSALPSSSSSSEAISSSFPLPPLPHVSVISQPITPTTTTKQETISPT